MRRYRNAFDVIAGIREEAETLVWTVNPGRTWTAEDFAAKTTEVTEAMTRKVTAGLTAQGRADLARKIRIAWERSA